jgi:hypothetical protein
LRVPIILVTITPPLCTIYLMILARLADGFWVAKSEHQRSFKQ